MIKEYPFKFDATYETTCVDDGGNDTGHITGSVDLIISGCLTVNSGSMNEPPYEELEITEVLFGDHTEADEQYYDIAYHLAEDYLEASV